MQALVVQLRRHTASRSGRGATGSISCNITHAPAGGTGDWALEAHVTREVEWR